MNKAYIFLSGEVDIEKEFYFKLDGDIYCGDGGANYAIKLGYTPKVIIGDFDSIDEEILNSIDEEKTKLIKYPKDKDFTDGELVIDYVTNLGYEEISILGALGGRTDHMLANINLLMKYSHVYFETENEKISLIEKGKNYTNMKDVKISFIPLSDVEKLTLKGFQFPLEKKDVKRYSSLCMSNKIVENRAQLNLKRGELLQVIQK